MSKYWIQKVTKHKGNLKKWAKEHHFTSSVKTTSSTIPTSNNQYPINVNIANSTSTTLFSGGFVNLTLQSVSSSSCGSVCSSTCLCLSGYTCTNGMCVQNHLKIMLSMY